MMAEEDGLEEVDPFAFEDAQAEEETQTHAPQAEEKTKESAPQAGHQEMVDATKFCPLPRCNRGEDGARGLIVGKRKYCLPHHRAFECVHGKFVKPLNDKDPRVHTDNAEFKAYKAIFGYKKIKVKGAPAIPAEDGNLEVANDVLEDVIAKNPENENVKGGKGGRGQKVKQSRSAGIQLTTFIETQGTKHSHRDITRRPKWDKILFARRMESLRGWTHSRIEAEWTKLDDETPSDKKDRNGDPQAPLRLPIPGWMVGEDAIEDVQENFHAKQVETATGARAMEAPEIAQAVEDCKMNFGELAAPSRASMLEKAAPESITSSDFNGECAILQALQKAEAKVQEQLEANSNPEGPGDAPSAGSADGAAAGGMVASWSKTSALEAKRRKTSALPGGSLVEDIGVARISASMAV